jgi:hypothetical protein
MFALAREHDVNPDVLKDYLIKTHNFVSSRDVTKDCYEIVCAWIMGAGK